MKETSYKSANGLLATAAVSEAIALVLTQNSIYLLALVGTACLAYRNYKLSQA